MTTIKPENGRDYGPVIVIGLIAWAVVPMLVATVLL